MANNIEGELKPKKKDQVFNLFGTGCFKFFNWKFRPEALFLSFAILSKNIFCVSFFFFLFKGLHKNIAICNRYVYMHNKLNV